MYESIAHIVWIVMTVDVRFKIHTWDRCLLMETFLYLVTLLVLLRIAHVKYPPLLHQWSFHGLKDLSVHTLHMSKPAITFVVKLLRDGLPRYILYTCLQPVITFVFKMLCDGLPRYILYTCPNL